MGVLEGMSDVICSYLLQINGTEWYHPSDQPPVHWDDWSEFKVWDWMIKFEFVKAQWNHEKEQLDRLGKHAKQDTR